MGEHTAWFKSGTAKRFQKLKTEFEQIKESWDNPEQALKMPAVGTGARTIIVIGGTLLAWAKSIQWQVIAPHQEIQTIDNAFPLDFSLGQVRVQATLSQIMFPENSPEECGLFSNMQTLLHQAMVEIAVQDVRGQQLFLSRGVFTQTSGMIDMGSPAIRQAHFQGVLYAHNVSQQFNVNTTSSGIGETLYKDSGGLA